MTRINQTQKTQGYQTEPMVRDFTDAGPLHVGIDIGSISCKVAVLDDDRRIRYLRYQRTHGRPMETAQSMLADLLGGIEPSRIGSMAGTGSAGRALCELLEIDFVNELICQTAAIRHLRPEVRTLIEMGGQDSKVTFLSDPNNPEEASAGRDMIDFSMNTNCAAGTGSFLDQQASRLGVNIEGEFGELALKSETPPRVAGRCSVFAKSDMIHLQQQATPMHDIVAGLCLGLVRNLKSSLCQGKEVIAPVAFCGGVASNVGVVRGIEEVFELGKDGLIVPDEHAVTGAIGVVLMQLRQGVSEESHQEPRVLLSKLEEYLKQERTVGHRIEPLPEPTHPVPASKVRSDLLEKARAEEKTIPAYLGVDVGSLSTNVVVMDENQNVLSKAYLMTAGRPLEAVQQGLEVCGKEVAGLVEILGAATTGSGRYLTGDFIGADLVINEITAQATGAALVDPTVDTIFEIGGQDSKYISLEEGVVVDFEMNHACAAGTGSFLEEQAERLGMSIKEEFANEAFKSKAPLKLGERCTVFMESDLLSYQQQGAERPDLTAGLAYSIVTNYLNRVVSHRRIGQKIFFQGGTAFNRATVAAFEAVMGKPIIVPDHHEVTGAYGAAELARRHMEQLTQTMPKLRVGMPPDHDAQQHAHASVGMAPKPSEIMATEGEVPASTFRGFELSKLQYEVRSFECKHCANNCEIKEVKLLGSDPLFYGSRCDRYNVKKDQDKFDHLPDLFAERQKMLEHFGGIDSQKTRGARPHPTGKDSTTEEEILRCAQNDKEGEASSGGKILRLSKASPQNDKSKRRTVGIPMSLSTYQFLPLWGTFLRELGFDVVLSGRSSKKVIHEGVEGVLAQACFPVKVAHGHVLELVKKEVDFIWLPSIVSMAEDYKENKHNQLCPYVQTIPYQVRSALKAKGIEMDGAKNHLIDLHVRFQDGIKVLRKNLHPLASKFGVSKSQINEALDRGLAAQRGFEDFCVNRGKEILDGLTPEQKACVIVSRPYNGCDPGVSLDLPRKLRKMNVLAIPIDFLDLEAANITEPELQEEMYWKYGQKIFRAAHIIRDEPRLNAIYISNFSCGPDSFVITFFKELMMTVESDGTERRKPALVLEIDEHSADAGVVTRLEAFHESLKAVESRRKPDEEIGPARQPATSPWKSVWGDCSGRTLYIPWMGDHSHALAASFRHCGQPAEVLSMADEDTLKWGRKYTSGKECLPCIVTLGDMLKKIREPGFDHEAAAFFMPGSSGPCRFGQYNCLLRLVLKQTGLPNTIPVVAPNQDGQFYKHFQRFQKDPTRLAYDGIAAIDLIYKVMLKLRPYELEAGSADAAYQKCVELIVDAIEQGVSEDELADIMDECGKIMVQVPVDRTHLKPRVTVVGEIYVRSHTFSNDNVVRKLEALGAEVDQAGFLEWLYYTNHTRKLMAKRWKDWALFLQNLLKNQVQHKVEKKLAAPLEKHFGPLAEHKVTEVLEEAKPYMHESFEGEAILSIGKIVETAHHGAAGAVNTMPFTCMPSTIVSGISRQISENFGGLPILNISYDGQQDPTLPTRLEAFMHQVRMYGRERAEVPVAAVR
jgi:predicted CoA-substrate-specific enzyme activase